MPNDSIELQSMTPAEFQAAWRDALAAVERCACAWQGPGQLMVFALLTVASNLAAQLRRVAPEHDQVLRATVLALVETVWPAPPVGPTH